MKKKILVIDDDPDFARAVSLLLESQGYQVTTAGEGETGFQEAQKETPNLVLLDVMMTHRTEGFDVVQKFHSDPRTQNIPIVVVTGISKETGVVFKYEPDEVWLPVKEVLEKPVSSEELLKVVEKLVGK